jgi:hypothetical protein
MSRREKKLTFQSASGSSTPTAIMLASSRLSCHSAMPVTISAMSENQRKFAGP